MNGLVLLESHLKHEFINGLIPRARGLLQTIDRALKMADVVRHSFVDVFIGLHLVDVFIKKSVENSCLDVHLVHGQLVLG